MVKHSKITLDLSGVLKWAWAKITQVLLKISEFFYGNVRLNV